MDFKLPKIEDVLNVNDIVTKTYHNVLYYLFGSHESGKRIEHTFCDGKKWLDLLCSEYINCNPKGQRKGNDGQRIWSTRDVISFIETLRDGTADLNFLVRLVKVNGRYELHIYDGGNRNRNMLRIIKGCFDFISPEELYDLMSNATVNIELLIEHSLSSTLSIFRRRNIMKVLTAGQMYNSVTHPSMDKIKAIGDETIFKKHHGKYLHTNEGNSNDAFLKLMVDVVVYNCSNKKLKKQTCPKIISDMIDSGELSINDPGIKLLERVCHNMVLCPRKYHKRREIKNVLVLLTENLNYDTIIDVNDWNKFTKNFLDVQHKNYNKDVEELNGNEYKRKIAARGSISVMKDHLIYFFDKLLFRSPKKYGIKVNEK